VRGGGDGDGGGAGAVRGAGLRGAGYQAGGGDRRRECAAGGVSAGAALGALAGAGLPRTSTGKVRRKAVAAWLEKIQSRRSAPGNGAAKLHGNGAFGASQDWLLALIAQISGEPHPGVGDELHLTEDLHLDSLGRVQLAAAIEDRLGVVSEDGMLDRVQTLGELAEAGCGRG
jgi:acyl carrier protein